MNDLSKRGSEDRPSRTQRQCPTQQVSIVHLQAGSVRTSYPREQLSHHQRLLQSALPWSFRSQRDEGSRFPLVVVHPRLQCTCYHRYSTSLQKLNDEVAHHLSTMLSG